MGSWAGKMDALSALIDAEPRELVEVKEARCGYLFAAAAALFVAVPLLPAPHIREMISPCCVTALFLVTISFRRRLHPASLKWAAMMLPSVPLVFGSLFGDAAVGVFSLFGFLFFLSCVKMAHERATWGYALFLLMVLGAGAVSLVEMFYIALRADVLHPFKTLSALAAVATPALVATFSLFVNHPVMGRMERYSCLRFWVVFGLLCIFALAVASSRSIPAFIALSAGILSVLFLRWEVFKVVMGPGIVGVLGVVLGWAVLSPTGFAASRFGFSFRICGETMSAAGQWLPKGRGLGSFAFDAPSFLSQTTRSHPLAAEDLWSAPSAAVGALYEGGLFAASFAITIILLFLLLNRALKTPSPRSFFAELVYPATISAALLLLLSNSPVTSGVWVFYAGLFGVALGFGGREEPLMDATRQKRWLGVLLGGLCVYFCGFLVITHQTRGFVWGEEMWEAVKCYEDAEAVEAARRAWNAAIVAPKKEQRYKALCQAARMARDAGLTHLAQNAVYQALLLHPHSARAHLVALSFARTKKEKVTHLLAALRWGVFRPTQADIERLRFIEEELRRLGRPKEAGKARKWEQNLSNFFSSP